VISLKKHKASSVLRFHPKLVHVGGVGTHGMRKPSSNTPLRTKNECFLSFSLHLRCKGKRAEDTSATTEAPTIVLIIGSPYDTEPPPRFAYLATMEDPF